MVEVVSQSIKIDFQSRAVSGAFKGFGGTFEA